MVTKISSLPLLAIFQGAAGVYSSALLSFLLAAVVFTAVDLWPCLKCNDQLPWWRNGSVRCDIFYVALNPFFKMALRFLPLALVMGLLLPIVSVEDIYAYLANGWGPLGRLSPTLQWVAFLLVSDFLMYWSHRLFHLKLLWSLHSIHHGPSDVDWTTAYRFHPLNFAFGPWLITALVIFLGTAPINIIVVAPFEAFMAYFVHSNLNVTLGPLRYLIATPVFHRWHHVKDNRGKAYNYSAIFSFWDVLFATFHMPSERLPDNYGVEHGAIPESFISQLVYPWRAGVAALFSCLR